MKTYRCKIKGIAPIVFSRPTKDGTPKTVDQEKKFALNKVYCNGKGLFVPNRVIKASMLKAIEMAKMKIERSSLRAKNLLKALLFVLPHELPLKPKKDLDDIQLFEVPLVVDQGKMRWTWYARTPDENWELQFDLKCNETIAGDFLRETLENAGLLCGIGGKRPEFGTFEVISFEEV